MLFARNEVKLACFLGLSTVVVYISNPQGDPHRKFWAAGAVPLNTPIGPALFHEEVANFGSD